MTGGAGFIGSHVVQRLLNENVAEVVVIDSMEFGSRENLPTDPRIRFILHPIESDAAIAAITALGSCDYAIHLAARKHNQSRQSPQVLIESNITGTQRIIQALAALRVKKLVFSSSLYAYGRTEGPPMKESDLPTPTTVYGISKLAGEHLCEWGYQTFQLPYTVLRLFFTYGPRQYPGMGYKSVIVKNFERILRDEPAIIRGDGLQALDYIYIDDVVEAILEALVHPREKGVYNIGSGTSTTIARLTDALYAVAGKTPALTYEPADETHGTSRVANVSEARDALGFEAKTSLEEGLQHTYAWLVCQKGITSKST